jgi:thioredoxin 1
MYDLWHIAWNIPGRIKTGNMSKSISGKSFEKEVKEAKTLSLVQFKAEWSGACQIIAPVYEELARHYQGTANFFITDIETDDSLEKEYGVNEVPTILFFKDGIIIDHSIGLTSKNTLIEKIENALTTIQNQ